MSLRRPTLKDAHGRRVPLLAHEILLPGLSDPQRRERLQRAGWHGGPQILGRKAPLIFAIVIATTLVFALVPMLLAQRLQAPQWIQMSLAILPAVVSLGGSIFWSRRLAPSAIGHTYLRARFCASCAYDLTDTPPNADALTLCPECGAAWNLAPPSESEPRA